MNYEYLINHWSQVTVLIALVTGCIGYLFKLFFSNRDKRRHARYEIFQEKKLNAYVDFNNSFIEMTLLLTTALNNFDVKDFQKNLLGLKPFAEEFYKKTITMHSYLNSETYLKYDRLYGKIMDVLMDINRFSSEVSFKLINPVKDKYAMNRLSNYVLASLNLAMEDFEKIKQEFQIYYRD